MIFKVLLEIIKNILLMDLVISFISTKFNNMIINELIKQNKVIENRKNIIKKLLRKFFNK